MLSHLLLRRQHPKLSILSRTTWPPHMNTNSDNPSLSDISGAFGSPGGKTKLVLASHSAISGAFGSPIFGQKLMAVFSSQFYIPSGQSPCCANRENRISYFAKFNIIFFILSRGTKSMGQISSRTNFRPCCHLRTRIYKEIPTCVCLVWKCLNSMVSQC